MRKGAAQKRKKHSLYVKRRNKKARAVLLVGSSIVLLSIFFLVKSLIAPAVSAFSSGSNDLKDKDIYSVLLIEKGRDSVVRTATLIVLQKADNKLYSINIPVYTKVDLPGRFGEEEFSKIAEIVSSLDGSADESDLLVLTTKKLLKVNVDRYLISDSESFDRIQGAVFNKELGAFLPWQLKGFIQQVDTNLNAAEAVEFISFSRKLSSRDIVNIDLNQVADINLRMRDISLNGSVARESLGVVILNGTGVGNVAKEVSQVAQNMGSRVSLVANADNEYQESYLVTDAPLSPTAIYLRSYFPHMNVVSKASAASLGEDLLERGDISVIVGFDILEQLQ